MNYLRALSCYVLFILLSTTFASAQTTYYPATGVYNGFLDQVNISECDNNNTEGVDIELSMRNGEEELVRYNYNIPASGSKHVILSDLVDISNKIGTYSLRLGSGQQFLGDKLHCRTVFYRPTASGYPKRFEYAYSLPVSNPQSGAIAGVYNSFDPAQGEAISHNWLSVINHDTLPFDATVKVYDSAGALNREVRVPNLAPGGRFDIALGHPRGQTTGLYVIVPDSNAQRYDATLIRYNQGAGGVYNFAFPLQASSGSCTGQPVLASTMGNGLTTNWLEIANANDIDIDVTVEVRDRFGDLVHSERPEVPAKGQYHVYLSDKIDPSGIGNVGSARVICDDPTDKLIIQSTFYGKVPGGTSIEWAYSTQELGRVPVTANAQIIAPVNTFVGMANWFKFADASLQNSQLDFSLYNQSGSEVAAGEQWLAGGGTADLDLHSILGADSVGSVVVSSQTTTSSYSGEMLRVLARADGEIGNIISIPGIISQNGIGGGSFKGDPQSLAKYRNKLTRTEADHLLSKMVFGGNGSAITRVVNDGLESSVERLMAVGAVSPKLREAAENWLDGNEDPREADENPSHRGVKYWWLTYLLKGPNPFKEKMALFWHDRFASSCRILSGGLEMGKCLVHMKLIRQYALGNYKTLLRKMTIDYLMLEWLNGNRNIAGSPDENYARELMELFTLGEQHTYCANLRYPCYSDTAELREFARALTGYTTQYISNEMGSSYDVLYNLSRHDDEEKVAWEGTPFETRGNWEPLEVSDLILSKRPKEVGRYIGGALFTTFCHDHPGERLKAQMADVLVASNWEVKPLLRRILNSEACFSRDAYKSQIKDPMTFAVGFLKRTGIPMRVDRLAGELADMGYDITNPPTIFGWSIGQREAEHSETTYWNAFPIEYANFITLALRSHEWDYVEEGTGDPLFEFCSLNPSDDARGEEVVDHISSLIGVPLNSDQRAEYVRYMDNVAASFENGIPTEEPELYDPRIDSMCREKIGGLLWMMGLSPNALAY